MAKKGINPIGVVFEGLKVYLANLDVFVKYLTFPVLGMFLGMFFLFAINYFYVTNLDNIVAFNSILRNEAVIMTLLLIITLPAFLIIIKCFIDYMVAFGAVNSMCLLGAKRIKAVREHTEIVKLRFAPYCILLIALSIIFAIIPILPITIIFLSLAVQVFVLEEDASPYIAIRKSIETVKNNFWLVLFSLIFMAGISYYAVPYLVSWFIGKTPVFSYLTFPVEQYLSLLPLTEINTELAANNIDFTFDVVLIAKDFVYSVIATIVTMYMMPFRSACCVYMYKNLINASRVEEIQDDEPKRKSSGKRGRKEK